MRICRVSRPALHLPFARTITPITKEDVFCSLYQRQTHCVSQSCCAWICPFLAGCRTHVYSKTPSRSPTAHLRPLINPPIPRDCGWRTRRLRTSQRQRNTAHTTDSERASLQQLVEAVGTGDTERIIASAKQLVGFYAAVATSTPSQLLSVEQIAMKFNLCTRSIWRLVAKGDLPQPILVGAARRWYAADISAYLAKKTAKRDAKFGKSPRSRAA